MQTTVKEKVAKTAVLQAKVQEGLIKVLPKASQEAKVTIITLLTGLLKEAKAILPINSPEGLIIKVISLIINQPEEVTTLTNLPEGVKAILPINQPRPPREAKAGTTNLPKGAIKIILPTNQPKGEATITLMGLPREAKEILLTINQPTIKIKGQSLGHMETKEAKIRGRQKQRRGYIPTVRLPPYGLIRKRIQKVVEGQNVLFKEELVKTKEKIFIESGTTVHKADVTSTLTN